MNKEFATEQEKFWAGEFGDNYIQRNKNQALIASNIAIFAKVFQKTLSINSLIEFGSNVGLNLVAINQLLPEAKRAAVEINTNAVKELETLGLDSIYPASILDVSLAEQYDFVFTKGVLIHIAPKALPAVYEKMYNSSKRYICVIEYYNPTPLELPYRGHEGKLYKRDFAGELMEKYTDLNLIDYGFLYHKDPRHWQEDMTWFVMEKRI